MSLCDGVDSGGSSRLCRRLARQSIVLGENVDRLQVLSVPAAIHIPLLNIPQSSGNKICSISFSSH